MYKKQSTTGTIDLGDAVFASTFVEIPSGCIEKRKLIDKKTAITTDRPQSKLQICYFASMC
jgi:hypothetical protein